MIKTVRGIFAVLLDYVYPPRCVFCRDVLPTGNREGVCPRCREEMPFLKEPLCARCSAEMPGGEREEGVCWECRRFETKKRRGFDKNVSALPYSFASRAVFGLKYRGNRHYAAVLVRLFAEGTAGRTDWVNDCDAFVPVPLHAKRRRKRGFNQAEALAEELSKLYGKPLILGNLVRIRNTGPQNRLSPAARRQNMAGAFACRRPEELQNKNIILVDDIFTTGSTLNECALTLKKAGIGRVFAMTITITNQFQKKASTNPEPA